MVVLNRNYHQETFSGLWCCCCWLEEAGLDLLPSPAKFREPIFCIKLSKVALSKNGEVREWFSRLAVFAFIGFAFIILLNVFASIGSDKFNSSGFFDGKSPPKICFFYNFYWIGNYLNIISPWKSTKLLLFLPLPVPKSSWPLWPNIGVMSTLFGDGFTWFLAKLDSFMLWIDTWKKKWILRLFIKNKIKKDLQNIGHVRSMRGTDSSSYYHCIFKRIPSIQPCKASYTWVVYIYFKIKLEVNGSKKCL